MNIIVIKLLLAFFHIPSQASELEIKGVDNLKTGQLRIFTFELVDGDQKMDVTNSVEIKTYPATELIDGKYQIPLFSGSQAAGTSLIGQFRIHAIYKNANNETLEKDFKLPVNIKPDQVTIRWPNNMEIAGTLQLSAYAKYDDEWFDISKYGLWSTDLGSISRTGLFSAPYIKCTASITFNYLGLYTSTEVYVY